MTEFPQPRSGYTLPVFACASAIAALRHLQNTLTKNQISLNLLNPPQTVTIPIEQVAKLDETTALAITRSDPGDNLDLTRNTPIWAVVERKLTGNQPKITIKGGEGIGKQINHEGKSAIYRYAHQLLQENLEKYLESNESITVTIILPEGRSLAQRTSNAAFGVLEGLSLLGTTGIAQPLSVSGQLDIFQSQLITQAQEYDSLVFCIGENGLNLAQTMGISAERLVKTANWLGSMLVTAATYGVKSILLFGYHGKLIKLAGGIFHTHHHLADGRLEIFTAHCAKIGIETPILQQLYQCATTEAALTLLRTLDTTHSTPWVDKVYHSLAETIDFRTQTYIYQHTDKKITVGCLLFDRDRQIIITSNTGQDLLSTLKNEFI